MSHQPRLVPHRNAGYDPWAVKVDWRWRCTVCGFAGIDPERWQEPEKQVFAAVTSGSTYAPTVGDTVEELVTGIDLVVETQYGTFAGCPHCGSPNWAFGSAPDLRW